MILRRIVAGLAAGALANAIQIGICVVADRPLTLALFISHFATVLLFHIAIATLFAEISKNRLWAAAAFLFPVMSVALHELDALVGTAGVNACAVGAVVFGVIWTVWLPRRGAPFVSTAAGSTIGAVIPYLHSTGFHYQLDSKLLLAAAVLTSSIATLAALFAGHPSGAWVPPIGWSARRFVLFACVAAVFIPVLQPERIPAPQSSESASHPSAILIVLDTVRADHLELYGYPRATMPGLTRFARESAVVVERAIANGASSLPSHASLFTGLYPIRHGAHKPFLSDPRPPEYAYGLHPSIPTLATLLARANYWTVGISSNAGPLSPTFGLSQGFDVYQAVASPRRDFLAHSPWGPEKISSLWLERIALHVSAFFPRFRDYLLGVPYKRAEEITDLAIEAVELAGDRPLFLFLNYMDAHSPYFPPADFMDRFPGRSPELMSSAFDATWWRAVSNGEVQLTDEERDHYVALYDAELSYLDIELDRFLTFLKQRPGWDEMLVIITSDHGEALGDHGGLEHSISLYDEITRVPLIVKPGTKTPGALPAGSVLSGPIESVDIFPLVLEHSGLPVPNKIDGIAWGAGRSHSFGWLYPSRSRKRQEELRAVQSNGWKLVESSSGKVELYQLDRDPGEVLDLSIAEQTVRLAFLKTLNDTEKSIEPPTAPAPTPALSQEILDDLRALGYAY